MENFNLEIKCVAHGQPDIIDQILNIQTGIANGDIKFAGGPIKMKKNRSKKWRNGCKSKRKI